MFISYAFKDNELKKNYQKLGEAKLKSMLPKLQTISKQITDIDLISRQICLPEHNACSKLQYLIQQALKENCWTVYTLYLPIKTHMQLSIQCTIIESYINKEAILLASWTQLISHLIVSQGTKSLQD